MKGFSSLGRLLLTEGTRDDIHFVHDFVSVSNPSSSGPVKTHSMHFIHKGNSTKLVGNITHLFKRAHSSCRGHDIYQNNSNPKNAKAKVFQQIKHMRAYLLCGN